MPASLGEGHTLTGRIQARLVARIPRGEQDRLGLVLAAALAALALARAIQVNQGLFAPEAIVWVGLALVVLVAGLVAPKFLERFGERPLMPILWLGLLLQFTQLVTSEPALYLTDVGRGDLDNFEWAMVAGSILGLAAIFGSARLRKIAFPLLIVLYVLAGAWIIRSTPDPLVDVYVVHQESIEALADGRNPYAITFPNVYETARPDRGEIFYGPGMLRNGRLQFGFQYPPLSLLLSGPGKLLAGDFRYAHLIAGAIAGALIASAGPGRLANAAATLLLFSPRSFFIIEQGWTELLMLMLLAATAFVAVRRIRLTPYLAGALVASKQYAVWFLPLVPLLTGGWRSGMAAAKSLAKALAVALVVTVPFFLWDARAFVYDLVTVQARLPFREDGLTFLTLWFRATGDVLPTWIGWVAAAAALGLVSVRAPRTMTGFAFGGAVVLAFFFAFGRSAFANYYYFILGALWLAVAVSATNSERT